MKVGLFFGSFNPIHAGHLILAEQVCELARLDQVWLVVSPQSPFKQKQSLLNEVDRYHLCELATQGNERLWASNAEFTLPRPSYTIDTLTALAERFPRYQFSLVMGADNLEGLHKWKNHEAIVRHYPIWVYPRVGAAHPDITYPGATLLNAPLIGISATRIREQLAAGQSVRYLVPQPALDYILAHHLYGA
ncbi:MAG: nicotinate-nucleotide adenylyltransferase [Bacteroidetes bacterium]|nr:nicotinate-nucleotide adenylyltransferase [Bacteroidota bacterium]